MLLERSRLGSAWQLFGCYQMQLSVWIHLAISKAVRTVLNALRRLSAFDCCIARAVEIEQVSKLSKSIALKMAK